MDLTHWFAFIASYVRNPSYSVGEISRDTGLFRKTSKAMAVQFAAAIKAGDGLALALQRHFSV